MVRGENRGAVRGRTITGATHELAIADVGRIDYDEAVSLQERLVERRIAGEIPDALLLVEHPPVITLGRGTRRENLIATPELISQRGVAVRESSRGGDVTYHGPGQRVGYVICDLNGRGRDVRRFLRDLEEALILVCESLDVRAFRRDGMTGVWTDGGKVAAIGVAVRRWVTYHGFALNVSADLSGFELIHPCGLAGEPVTSLSRLLGREVHLAEVDPLVATHMGDVFVTSVSRAPLDWITDVKAEEIA